jgi:hypothetical protein
VITFEPSGILVLGVTPTHTPPAQEAMRPVWEALVSGDDRVSTVVGGVRVSADRLRSWSAETLDGLGVRVFTGHLTVSEFGTAGHPQYALRLTWDGRQGTVEGTWLLLGPARFLLSASHQAVLEVSQETMGRPRTQVFAQIARLQRMAAADPTVALVGRLATRRIRCASGVRVLLRKDAMGELIPEPVLVDLTQDDPQPIDLAPADLERAAAACVRSDDIVPLGGDQFVVMDASAARNTVLTLAAGHASQEARRRFVQNPTAFLPDEAAFDEKDYSSRVVGVGEAPPAELGTVASKGRDWASDPGGLAVSLPSGELWVPTSALEEFHTALAAAVDAGQPSLNWSGASVPASPEIVAAVGRALRERPDSPTEAEARSRPKVLLIRENDVSLSWVPAAGVGRQVTTRALPSLQVELEPHQVAALETLRRLWTEGAPGALLCDDMGLGKTLQALVFGAWVAAQRGAGDRAPDIPVGIIAPPSLLEGWLGEMEQRLTPEALPRVLWGQSQGLASRVSRSVMNMDRFVKGTGGAAVVLEHARVDLEALREARPDVLLMGYDTLRRLQFAIGQIRFGVLIADEAQEVKEPHTLRSRALRAMSYDFGLALTGTPIENSWRDLWTICDFAVPGRLGTLKDFASTFRGDDVVETGSRLAASVAPVMIRRTRATALRGLPPCTIVADRRPMPEAQALAYRAEVQAYANRATGILGLLQELGRVSLHPRIRAEFSSAAEANAWAEESARTAALWSSLRRFASEGQATLVFVRSLAMQDTLRAALQWSFGLDYIGVLNGQISQAERQRVVRHTREGIGFRVLIVSPEVGGAGWNLQFASRAVLLERPFNPATEAQMIARIHRLGQQVPVEVVTPVATLAGVRSFDEILDEMLTEKKGLAESVLAPANVSDGEVSSRFQSVLSSS